LPAESAIGDYDIDMRPFADGTAIARTNLRPDRLVRERRAQAGLV